MKEDMDIQRIHATIETFLRTNYLYDDQRTIEEDESFLETGILDSTGILELIAFLEAEYRIRFQDHELVAANFDSLSRVTRFMANKLGNGGPAPAEPPAA